MSECKCVINGNATWWSVEMQLHRQRSTHTEKSWSEKKTRQKSTYPPPADGLCARFLCKFQCSANEPAAQAGRGALQAIGHFTKCKVLKGNEARLHGGAGCAQGRGCDGVPGFIGRKLLKRGIQCVFKNAHVLFETGIGCLRGEAEFPARHGCRGLWRD